MRRRTLAERSSTFRILPATSRVFLESPSQLKHVRWGSRSPHNEISECPFCGAARGGTTRSAHRVGRRRETPYPLVGCAACLRLPSPERRGALSRGATAGCDSPAHIAAYAVAFAGPATNLTSTSHDHARAALRMTPIPGSAPDKRRPMRSSPRRVERPAVDIGTPDRGLAIIAPARAVSCS